MVSTHARLIDDVEPSPQRRHHGDVILSTPSMPPAPLENGRAITSRHPNLIDDDRWRKLARL